MLHPERTVPTTQARTDAGAARGVPASGAAATITRSERPRVKDNKIYENIGHGQLEHYSNFNANAAMIFVVFCMGVYQIFETASTRRQNTGAVRGTGLRSPTCTRQ